MAIINLQLQSAARVSAVVRVIRYKVNKVDSFINFFSKEYRDYLSNRTILDPKFSSRSDDAG